MSHRHHTYILVREKQKTHFTSLYHSWNYPALQPLKVTRFYEMFLKYKDVEGVLSIPRKDTWSKVFRYSAALSDQCFSDFTDDTNMYLEEGEHLYQEDNDSGWNLIYIFRDSSEKPWNISFGFRPNHDEVDPELKDEYLPLDIYINQHLDEEEYKELEKVLAEKGIGDAYRMINESFDSELLAEAEEYMFKWLKENCLALEVEVKAGAKLEELADEIT